ncbi:MAG: hypothetical protein AAF849_23680 [Bacteroidota bacterium]
MGITRSLYLLKAEHFQQAEKIFQTADEQDDRYDIWGYIPQDYNLITVYLDKSHNKLDDLFRGGHYGDSQKHPEGLKTVQGKVFLGEEGYYYISAKEKYWVYNFLVEQNFSDRRRFLKLILDYEWSSIKEEQQLDKHLSDYTEPNGKNWEDQVKKIKATLSEIGSRFEDKYIGRREINKYFYALPYHIRYIYDMEYYYSHYLAIEKFYREASKEENENWVFQNYF